jgi:hypothetical protein
MIRSSSSMSDFSASFQERLRGMARTHEVLSSYNWGDADVEQLLRATLSPFSGKERRHVVIRGRPVPPRRRRGDHIIATGWNSSLPSWVYAASRRRLSALTILENFWMLKHSVSGPTVREMSASVRLTAPAWSRPKILPIGPSLPLPRLPSWITAAKRDSSCRSTGRCRLEKANQPENKEQPDKGGSNGS